jgi:hypothetical protein
MGPRRPRFWCPSWRLGAFAVAWAVSLNLFLQVLRPELAAADASGVEDGSLERRKRRLEKRRRAIEDFLNGRWHGARVQEPVAVVLADVGAEEYLPASAPEALPARLRVVDFPLAWPTLSAQMRAWESSSPAINALLAVPDHLVTAAARLLGQMRSGDGGVLDSLLDVNVDRRDGSLLSEFLSQLGERQQRYFASYEESTLADTQDLDDFLDDQRKLMWDALKRTYAARYRIRADETLRDAAYDPATWRGLDFAVVPPLAVGYALYRGLEKRFSFAGTRLRVSIEALSEWREDDLPAGLALEWAPKGWPVGLIASAGMDGGEFRMDFVGIGTNLEMVRRVLALQRVEPGDRRPR